ncbi:Septum formation protein Maf [Hartmannibacter diazotrophicus]|uniref:Nucleoside triphosphate pyrophosphatase n=1 Tax=Hartmannibacter diazotrophicus TaxID=1482074 RepID=A0A2C9DCZ3_9HYPH|nr:Maf-like protein [Hartmannibacter diazotrophicus]SON58192.1 Septum formation protein Maf [Hartmannibacter diazotrophicus]
MVRIVLASNSAARASLLTHAGLIFERRAASVDERAVESTLEGTGAGPDDIAQVLADVKALDVSGGDPDALVIGADQTLSLDGRRYNKPGDLARAYDQLMTFSGRTHILSSAVSCARGGEIVWRHVSEARMSIRRLSPAFIRHYLEIVGDRALTSVGAYQLEGMGIQLFEAIDGDYFTILGLPLLPLLGFLREEGVIDT